MFDKLKELNRLKKAQSEIKKQLEQIFVTAERGGNKVVIRGDKRIEKIELDGEENKALRDLLNDASKDVDKKVEKQMRGQLKDLGFPDL
jgi:DNA-binding protein YbaB